MKISKISTYALMLATLAFTGCQTTKNVTEPAKPAETVAVEQQTAKVTSVKTDTLLDDEPSVEVRTEEDEEYDRSTNAMEGYVSKQEFSEDKNEILRKIAELDKIMKSYDYNSWVKYVDQESIDYWSSTKNLHRAASKLPVKGLKLESLQDYFKYIFIQARVGKKIDEIRYESTKSVKAVQVRTDQDVVYYFFHKVDGKWYVHIPPLED